MRVSLERAGRLALARRYSGGWAVHMAQYAPKRDWCVHATEAANEDARLSSPRRSVWPTAKSQRPFLQGERMAGDA
eukprot:5936141-Pleurochrysis_carterae.AAC.2